MGKIKYSFIFPDDSREEFVLDVDSETNELLMELPASLPNWTRLDFHQCPNCTLTMQDQQNCPLMIHLINVVSRFDRIVSYDQVHVSCETENRLMSRETTAQKGLSAIMGLLIAYSGCPHARFFRPMAYFHLPFATEIETIYRATSMYLLAQYFVQKNGGSGDFELKKLKEIYQNMQTVNRAIVKRLNEASSSDSSVNAIVLLDLFAKDIPYVIEESLDEIEFLFLPYLEK